MRTHNIEKKKAFGSRLCYINPVWCCKCTNLQPITQPIFKLVCCNKNRLEQLDIMDMVTELIR